MQSQRTPVDQVFKANYQHHLFFLQSNPQPVPFDEKRESQAVTGAQSNDAQKLDSYNTKQTQCMKSTSVFGLESKAFPVLAIEPSHIGPNGIKVTDYSQLVLAPPSIDEGIRSQLLTLFARPDMDQLSNFAVSATTNDLSSERCNSVGNKDNTDDSKPVSSVPSGQQTQSQQWNQKLTELEQYKNEYGHCLVPLGWKRNPSLSHWVKRQRYQYNLKALGKHSTLTPEREDILNRLGFVWDSHAAAWEEKRNDLQVFQLRHGHCNVPTKYPDNPQLSIWVKCQRRQYKLLRSGRKSTITCERTTKLLDLGFVFDPRQALPHRNRIQIYRKQALTLFAKRL